MSERDDSALWAPVNFSWSCFSSFWNHTKSKQIEEKEDDKSQKKQRFIKQSVRIDWEDLVCCVLLREKTKEGDGDSTSNALEYNSNTFSFLHG